MSDGSVDVEIKLEDKKAKSQANKVGKDIGKSVTDGTKTAEKALDGVSSKFGNAFKDGSKVASEAIGGVGDAIDDVGSETDSAGGRFSQAFGSAIPIAAAAAAAAIAAATLAVINFSQESVDVGMGFDKAMSQVAATMGKTVDEIQDLRDFAQEMGATTAFSATQSAEALNYMALAGYDAEKSMAMLPTVLNLAAAGGMELATASDMVTDAQSALGLSLDETSEMVDKMAMASSKSNTSVAQLGEAFLTVGGTAKNLAGGTTELAMSLGILADNGVKGAEGGTALRNIILSLSAPTDKAREKMEELGLQVFDSAGNMRALDDVFGDLSATLATMTQEEQTQALNEIFNKVDLKSVNALLGTTAERFDELAGNIDNAQGSAQKMADTQLDNLAGDITLLQSATEGFQISISDYLTPSLRSLAQIGAAAFSQLKESWESSMAADNFIGAGQEIGHQLILIVNALIEQIPALLKTGIELISGFLIGVAREIPSMITTIITAIAQSIPMILQALINVADALIGAIPYIVDGLVSSIPTIITAIVDALVSSIDVLINGFIQLFLAVVDAIPQITLALYRAAPDIIKALVDGLVKSVNALINGFIQLFTAIVDAMPEIINTIVPMIPEIVDAIVNALVSSIDALVQGFIELFAAFIEATPLIIANIIPLIPKIVEAIVSALVSMVSSLTNAAVRLFTGFISGIVQSIPGIVSKVSEVGSRILSTIGSIPGRMIEVGRNIVQGLWDGIGGSVSWLIGKIQGFCSDALGAIKGFFGIQSPSKLMRDVVGRMLPRGIVIGWEMEDLPGQLTDLLDKGLEQVSKAAKDYSLDIGSVSADSITVGFDRQNPMAQIADTVKSGFDAISMMVQTAGNNVTTNNQTLNFNSPVSSPDEIARTMRMQQRYGLAGQNL